MKPRTRSISNLYFRWGSKIKLDAEDVAIALERAGLIERIGPDRYREVARAEKMPEEKFNELIFETLTSYKGQTYG